MANRDVLAILCDHSTLLTYIDLTDWTISCTEFNHTEEVEDLRQDPDGTTYISFDTDGGRQAKFLHDGQLADAVNDLIPAQIGVEVPYLNSSGGGGGDYTIVNDFPIGGGAVLRTTDPINNPYGEWKVIGSLGQELAVFPHQYYNLQISFQLEGQTRYYDPLANTIYNDEVLKRFDAPNFFVQNDKIVIPVSFQVYEDPVWVWKEYLVTLDAVNIRSINPIDSPVASAQLLRTISNEDYYNLNAGINPTYSPVVVLGNGDVVITGREAGSVDIWNGLSFTRKVLTQSYQPSAEIAAASFLGTTNRTVIQQDYDLPGSTLGYKSYALDFTAITETVLVTQTYSPDVSATSLNTSRLLASNDFIIDFVERYDNDTTDGDGDTVHVIDGTLLIFDLSDGSLRTRNLRDKALLGRISQNGDMNLDDGFILSLQAYEVNGVVKKDAVGIATEAVLVDNASMRIVGRTMTDAVTGAYSFRCYNPGKKSVLVKHPVNGGMRIAAEVTPTLKP